MMNDARGKMNVKTQVEIDSSGTRGTYSITSAGRNVPLLGMLLDRTSFDEADGFGVAPDEVKTKLSTYQAPPPTLMKNGKVRRRLRWRPRSPRKLAQAKQQQQQTDQQNRNGQQSDIGDKELKTEAQQTSIDHSQSQQVSIDHEHMQAQQHLSQTKKQNDNEGLELAKASTDSTTVFLDGSTTPYEIQEKAKQTKPELIEQQLAKSSIPPPPPRSSRGRTLHQQRGRGVDSAKLNNRIPFNLSQCGTSMQIGSSASVVSHVSRQSRVSVHSFASTETAAMSNKKKDQLKKFIIRRPNYYPSEWSSSSGSVQIDGNDSILDASSHSKSLNSDEAQHSRFSPSTVGCNPMFAGQLADVVNAATRTDITTIGYMNTGANTSQIEKSVMPDLGTSVGRSLPPVLPKPKPKANKPIPTLAQRDVRSLPPVLKRLNIHHHLRKAACSPVVPVEGTTDLLSSVSESTMTRSMSQYRESSDPILYGHDEIEEDRRVDLRIVPSHLSELTRCNSNIANDTSISFARDPDVRAEGGSLFSPSESQLIEELRSQSFATASSNNVMFDIIVTDKNNNSEENSDDLRHECHHNNNMDAISELRDDVPEPETETQGLTEQHETISLKTTSSTISNHLLSIPAAIKLAVQESFIKLQTTQSNISTNKTSGSLNNMDNTSNRSALRSLSFHDNPSSTAVEVVKLRTPAGTNRLPKAPVNKKHSDEIRFSMASSRHSAPPVSRVIKEKNATQAISDARSVPLQLTSSVEDGITFKQGHASPSSDKQDNAVATFEADASGNQAPKESVEYLAFIEAEKNLQAIQEVATEHLQQGEYSEALEVFQEILRGLLTRYGEEHSRVGTAVHNIGVVHMRRGDYNKALVAYKEAVRVRKLVLDADHPDIAASLAQLGMAYLEVDKHQRAIGAFRESLKIRRKSFGNYHPKVAKVLNNIGCALYELDELEVARVAFEEALDIQRHLLRTNAASGTKETNHNATLLSIASTQSNIASIKLYFGAFETAVLDLEEALEIQQSVLGDGHVVVQRTKESLVWLENQVENAAKANTNIYNNVLSGKRPGFLGTTKKGNDEGVRDARSRTREILNKLTRTSSPPTKAFGRIQNSTALVSDMNSSNGVLGTLERSLRKIHADLDYMSCGGG
jgi:tetratricopeptide (TPR) repeat protein